MTPLVADTQRRRIGGWAALVVAVSMPLTYGVLLLGNGDLVERASSGPILLVNSIRFGALMVCVGSLHAWYKSVDRSLSRVALVAGLIGSAAAVLDMLIGALGNPPIALSFGLEVGSGIGVGAWLILGGTILSRSDDVRRIGWIGQLGGAGWIMLIVGVASPFEFPSTANGGPGLLDYGSILVVFALVFLVRIWQYTIRGRLPGPGLI